MPENNQVSDRYNPPGIDNDDFEEIRFSEIEQDDLFWLTTVSGNDNPPYRKLDDSSGGNTKTRLSENFKSNDVVYQRT